jgi:ABC-2 type transport system ATP-binding protein
VTVNDKHYRDHPCGPLHEVGALLEARSCTSGRSAYSHLLSLARRSGYRGGVSTSDRLVGLHDVARKRVGQFSPDGPTTGVASALLGDPRR